MEEPGLERGPNQVVEGAVAGGGEAGVGQAGPIALRVVVAQVRGAVNSIPVGI